MSTSYNSELKFNGFASIPAVDPSGCSALNTSYFTLSNKKHLFNTNIFVLPTDGQQAHSVRHVGGVKGHVQPQDMKHALPQDIDSHAFNKYVNIYFKVSSSLAI